MPFLQERAPAVFNFEAAQENEAIKRRSEARQLRDFQSQQDILEERERGNLLFREDLTRGRGEIAEERAVRKFERETPAALEKQQQALGLKELMAQAKEARVKAAAEEKRIKEQIEKTDKVIEGGQSLIGRTLTTKKGNTFTLDTPQEYMQWLQDRGDKLAPDQVTKIFDLPWPANGVNELKEQPDPILELVRGQMGGGEPQARQANGSIIQAGGVQDLPQESAGPRPKPYIESVTRDGVKIKIPRDPAEIQAENEAEIRQKLAIQRATQKVESAGKIEIGQRAALNNLELVSGVFKEMADTYAGALREDGMGSAFKAAKSSASLALGGIRSEKYAKTSEWEGIKTEIITRLMPMLTQQGEKPGSVRLVATVFERLSKTVPSKNTSAKNGRNQMAKTLRNMYRFARAAQMLNVNNDTIGFLDDEDKLDIMSGKIARLASRLEIKGGEEKELEGMIAESLRPIDVYIAERDGKPLPKQQTESRVADEDLLQRLLRLKADREGGTL